VEFILIGIIVLLLGLSLWQRHNLILLKSELKTHLERLSRTEADFALLRNNFTTVQSASSAKDILIERSTNAMEQANTYLKAHQDYIKQKEEELEVANKLLAYEQQQYSKLLNQKKSSEVRTGKIVEQVAPFLEDYPLPAENARFIGEPIDFIHFEEDKITFVEVKSGKSQLSPKQKNIRNLITDGKVDFILYRIKGDSDGE